LAENADGRVGNSAGLALWYRAGVRVAPWNSVAKDKNSSRTCP
jgi:hypothetical protein